MLCLFFAAISNVEMEHLNINSIKKWPDYYKDDYLMEPAVTTPGPAPEEASLANIYLEDAVKYCIPVHILLGVSPLVR